jgi:hypothetical protein
MAVRYSDSQIDSMLREPKPIPPDFRSKLQLRSKRGHSERETEVIGQHGTRFQLVIRQSSYNVFDFSLVLAVAPDDSNQLFRLCRYNGRSHEHTNRIEGESFFAFHIHKATERYQELGGREDGYAAPTDRYSNLEEALRCLLSDNGFVRAAGDHPELEL